jgi:glycerol 3-phosphatase-2
VRTAYITNNASRAPAEVAVHLAELGFPAAAEDVVASSQAAAALRAEQLPPGSPVLVVGTAALGAELTRAGLTLTDRADQAVAVVQGHSPDTGWRLLAEATVALRAGALWVACNLDPTLPTERGPLPGNGSMVAALRTASGREPQVAGKPAPALLRDAVRRTGARSPLMIGDRLDTDVEGGRAAGVTTLLVFTGVSDAAELLATPPARRPDYIDADLGALTRPADELAPGPRAGWQAVVTAPGALSLAGSGDPVDALRALCAAHWAASGGPVRVSATDAGAAAALRALGLDGDAACSATVAGSAAADPATGGP